MAGFVRTVRGDVAPEALGFTLPHEHLFLQIEGWAVPEDDADATAFAAAPVSVELLSRLRRRALSNRDNCRLDDLDVALAEVADFAAAGGGTIVELTMPDLGRDIARLAAVSTATGVHVVAGCGFYVEASHPARLASFGAEAIAEELERELRDGLDGCGSPGVIGEIGTGSPITPQERTVLRGAALAHTRTGAPISVHLFPAGNTAWEVVDILGEAGADLNQVALCHLDGQDPIRAEEHAALAATGAYVEYDVFGACWSSDDMRELFADRVYWSPPPSDQQRVRAIKELISAGAGDRVLISHDICTKIQQARWGGSGFSHIPRYMVPFFRANGLAEADIDALVRANPQRWLTWQVAAP